MRRTIAYVDHADEIGGAEKSLCELIAHLDRDRWEPLVLHRPGAEWLAEAEASGARLSAGIPESGLYAARREDLSGGRAAAALRLLRSAPVVNGIRRALRAADPALVHTNSTKMHLMAGAAARLAGLPVVWHMRDLLSTSHALRWLHRAVVRVRPEVIAISDAVAEQFTGMPCRVHVVRNGVPLDRFQPAPPSETLRDELGIEAGAPVVCIVGRLTPWKGHRTLLRAWPEVMQRHPDARLLIIGEVAFWDESYLGELQELAEQLGISGSVVWAGFRDNVPELLRLSQMLVLPSDGEPFGRVLIEAMGTGLPVVASASGGVPEIVLEGETGLLVPTGEAGPLGDAISELLATPDRAREMGAAGRERATRHFDIRRVAEEVGEIYEAILD